MADDELIVEEDELGTTRRRVLKRAAVGAAAVWAVPMVVSTSSAMAVPNVQTCIKDAIASGSGHPCTLCPACENTCGPVGSESACCCFVGKNGCCFCGFSDTCTSTSCRSNRDCPPGFQCAYTCCSVRIQCVETCAHHFPGTGSAKPAGAGPRQGSH
jgi:hypothetical protein